jgi:hypothetical protein
MTLGRSPIFRIIIALTILAMPLSAFAKDNVGTAVGGGAAIEWQLKVSGHDRVDMVVLAPDGTAWARSFPAGRTPSLRLLDLGSNVEDGQYNYELRVAPNVPSDVKKKLAAARAANDEAAARKVIKEAGISAPVQSGTFTILNGMIVSPNGVEADANDSASTTGPRSIGSEATTVKPRLNISVEDQVIADDLIVQGSICAGFDCVNNESFGADTLRLKENNLRIHFDDTSTSAGYAANDWRIVANDQASGGANYLAFEDSTAGRNTFLVEAGAPANALYVDSTGNIGISQSAPLLDLHITTTDTPAMRYEQTSGGGFTAQTWDIGANEANFFVRDLTGGSRLSFRIRPGAPTSSIDIAADGSVGIGTASPDVKLHVFGTATTDTFVGIGPDPASNNTPAESALNIGYSGSTFGRASGFLNVRPDASAVAPNPSLRFMTANTVRMLIDNEGFIGLGTTANPDAPIHYTNGTSQARLTTAGVWQDASSRAAKDDIIELNSTEAMDALRALNPVKYHYKVLPDDPKVGFIAEDVPDLVATPERQGLSALDIVAVVTKVVQEQQKTIEQLNQRINELEKQNQ